MADIQREQACIALAKALMDFLAAMSSGPEPETPKQEYFTVKELAEQLYKTEDTIRCKIRAGEFGPDAIRDGRTYLVPPSGLQFYYDNHSAAYKPSVSQVRPQREKFKKEVGRI